MICSVRFVRFAVAVCLVATSSFFASNCEATVRLANPCTLEWEPSISAEVTGYAVYYGKDGSPEASREDVGMSTTVTFTNLLADQEYYFYVVAYNELAMESEPSELVYYTPGALTPVIMCALAEGGIELLFRAAPGTTCRVEFTPSLEVPDWQPLTDVVADENGNVTLTDPPADVPARFYRAVLP